MNHFDRLNALVDRGLASLSALELKTLLVFLRHADANGISFPGPDLIAGKIGCTVRTAYKAIRQLERKRRLETIHPGGGRGKIARRRIITETLSAADSVSMTENPVQRRTKPCPAETRNPVHPRPKTLSATDRGTEHRTTQQQQGGCAAAAGDDPEQRRKAAVLEILAAEGIGEPKRGELAENPKLWPVHIALVARQADTEHPANRAGWIITRIGERLPVLIEPKEICALINAGRVARIAGVEVCLNGQRAKFSNGWLDLPGGTRITKDGLRADAIDILSASALEK